VTPVEVRDVLDATVRRLILLRFDVERLVGRDRAAAVFDAAMSVDAVRARIDFMIGTGEVPEEGEPMT
jgi:hypothetical protein